MFGMKFHVVKFIYFSHSLLNGARSIPPRYIISLSAGPAAQQSHLFGKKNKKKKKRHKLMGKWHSNGAPFDCTVLGQQAYSIYLKGEIYIYISGWAGRLHIDQIWGEKEKRLAHVFDDGGANVGPNLHLKTNQAMVCDLR